MPQRRYNQTSVAVIGTGLIGASIALAARAAGCEVAGWDSDRVALRTAVKRKAITRAAADLTDAVATASIVVLALPLDALLTELPRVFATVREGALIIDVAGVKSQIAARARSLLARRRDVSFVSGHPMAGSEFSGPAAADKDLLRGRVFALYAPAQRGRTAALAAARRFARSLGAEPLAVEPANHDRAVAALSTLPQLTSVALAIAASDSGASVQPRLAGPGYRDATRLAASPFATWKPVLDANRLNALRSIRALAKRVGEVESALVRSDWPGLKRLFSRAAAERRRVKPR